MNKDWWNRPATKDDLIVAVVGSMFAVFFFLVPLAYLVARALR